MFLFNAEFERKFHAEFARLKPCLSQTGCYGVSLTCAVTPDMSPEKINDLQYLECLSYRIVPLWYQWNDANETERRLLYLYRLTYMLDEGLQCVRDAGEEWHVDFGSARGNVDVRENANDIAMDVIREIEWLLSDRGDDIRLLKMDAKDTEKLAGVAYFWHYQHWIDIEDDER